VAGTSAGSILAAFVAARTGLGKLSKSTASRICSELRERCEAFKRRDLYEVRLAALYPPRVVQHRGARRAAQRVGEVTDLVAFGARYGVGTWEAAFTDARDDVQASMSREPDLPDPADLPESASCTGTTRSRSAFWQPASWPRSPSVCSRCP
jgi:hypothetical protein